MTDPVDISTTTILVSLSISEWTGIKRDKRETRAVESKHALRTRAARVSKTLMPTCSSLKRIHEITREVRRFFAYNTLPWGDAKQRIMRSSGFMSFNEGMMDLKSKWDAAVNEFIDEYEDERVRAAYDLNTLYSDDDYPDPERIRQKFSFSISFSPVATASDFRVKISQHQADALREQIEESNQRFVQDAMKDAWQRLYEVVSHTAEKLSDPDAIFRDSMVENVADLVALLPSLNIADDPEMKAMGKELTRAVCKFNPDTLRKDKDVRSDAADQVNAVLDKMAWLYG